MAQINRLQQLIEKLECKVCAQGGTGAAPHPRSVLGHSHPLWQQPPSPALALSQSCTHAPASADSPSPELC